jgi:hypothetical protein
VDVLWSELKPQRGGIALIYLPEPGSKKRWVVRRKAQVVAAVRGGLLSLDDACSRYKLSLEEFLSWESLIDRHGLSGLHATRILQYKE